MNLTTTKQEALKSAWVKAGFGLREAVRLSRSITIELKVNEHLGRYTSVYVVKGKNLIDVHRVFSPEELERLCLRLDACTGQGGNL